MPDETQKPAPRVKPCPVCGKPAIVEQRPFCSARCKDVDLNRWLSGAYAIPASDTGDDEDDAPPPRDNRDRP
jgi:hypothetical protein